VAKWIITALAILAAGEGLAIAGMLFARKTADGAATSIPQTPPPVKSDSRAAMRPGRELSTESRDGASAAAAPAATTEGVLEVQSEPPGARVIIDGKPAGATPVTLSILKGPHAVVITDGKTTTTRTITATAGGTSTLVASLSPATVAAGWVSINVPVELQVRESGSIIGITTADRLMLPAGHHELEVVSTTLGIQQRVPVDIQSGKTAKVNVTVPNGSLSVNALPWANVWLDDQPLTGTTPFANLAVSPGAHELVFRHPQLGEHRETVVVTAKTPVRLVADLRKK